MCEPTGVVDRNRIPDARQRQRAVFTVVILLPTTADSMKAVAMEGGALKLDLTEQTIFKLIWVKCVFFVVWLHKDYKGALHGPPATNYNYLQTV